MTRRQSEPNNVQDIYTVSQKMTMMLHTISDIHERILIIFGKWSTVCIR